MRALAASVLFVLFTVPLAAQDPPAPDPAPADTLKTLGFGIGLALRWNPARDIVPLASVDPAGVIRADQVVNTSARFSAEIHTFPWKSKDGDFGVGPFVAAEVGDGQFISTVGAGLMVGWRTTGTRGLGLGVGYAVSPSVLSLGPEFTVDKPAPTGPDGKSFPLRYVTTDRGSILFMASFVF